MGKSRAFVPGCTPALTEYGPAGCARRHLLAAWREESDVTLEFVAAPAREDIQNRLLLLDGETEKDSFENGASHVASATSLRRFTISSTTTRTS